MNRFGSGLGTGSVLNRFGSGIRFGLGVYIVDAKYGIFAFFSALVISQKVIYYLSFLVVLQSQVFLSLALMHVHDAA